MPHSAEPALSDKPQKSLVGATEFLRRVMVTPPPTARPAAPLCWGV